MDEILRTQECMRVGVNFQHLYTIKLPKKCK